MKTLWLCNGILKRVAKALDIAENPVSGWLDGAAEGLLTDGAYTLTAVFPYSKNLRGTADGIGYVTFGEKDRKKMRAMFVAVLREIKPDIVHIFGTEFYHSKAMAEACKGENIPFVVGIQGLVSEYARHYFAFLPEKIIRKNTFRDLLRRNNIKRQADVFRRRGKWEIETLCMAEHVIGRTDWDKACVYAINPNADYHFCNETLRPAFYGQAWSADNCERHSLFASQSGYPIKGFHLLLEAAAILKRAYPDLKIYTTGASVFNPTFSQRLHRTYYKKYLADLIVRYGLQDSVVFLGSLKEEEMCRQYLKAHVFVLPSSIENSPNSVGEATMLGVPTVASDVGGVKNLMTHGEDGFVYPYDEPKVLAWYIKKIFDDDELALRFSESARKRAEKIYDVQKNADRLREIYKTVTGKRENGS